MRSTGLIWSGAMLLAMLLVSVYGWLQLPDNVQIPIHWNSNGEVDGYGSKPMALLMLPGLSLFLIVIMAAIPSIEPRRANLESSRIVYLASWIGVVAVMAICHLVIVLSVVHDIKPSLELVFAAVGVFLAVCGNYMAKSRSNWFVGLKTPWTLTSEAAWSVGNRIAGWGMVVVGIVSVFASFFAPIKLLVLLQVGGLTVAFLAGTILSYLVWKRDPERSR